MAEEVVEVAPKKGGNKMMIIIVAVLMLITGGFFGLKMSHAGGKAAGPPLPELGVDAEHILEVHEFLVNLAGSNDGGKYLRTDISVQTAKSFKKDDLTLYLPAVEDAINAVLSKYSTEEIKQLGFKDKLKKEIAQAANEALVKANPPSKDEKKSDQPLPHHPEWDSDSGPILRVYYTSFAFQ